MNSTWLITSELAYRRARKELFTRVVYSKHKYHMAAKVNAVKQAFEQLFLYPLEKPGRQ